LWNLKEISFRDFDNSMEEEGLKKVLELLSLGENKINLKEREFRVYLFLCGRKNGKKFKKVSLVKKLDG
jgi:hypothetical protein